MNTKQTILITLCVVLQIADIFAQSAFPDGQNVQSNENHGKRWVLLVGINNYDAPHMRSPKYCITDVKAFREVLVDPSLCGFNPDRVFLMTDKDTDRIRIIHTNVLFRLEKLVELVKPQDTFAFHFFGHGMT